MSKEERWKQIIEVLRTKGSIEVDTLCKMFDVANMTIRRDLNELEKKGLLIRSHGGAFLTDADILVESPFHIRLASNKDSKTAIAARAVSYLSDGQKVFIGSGTTTHYFCQRIDNSKKLMVVTDAINVASELITRSSVSVIQAGGDLRSNTLSVTGSLAENFIRQFRFKYAFMGVTGIGGDGSLFIGSFVQLGIYQAILDVAGHIVILADSSKVGRDDFVNIGKLSERHTLITDKDRSDFLIKHYDTLGTEVITV